MKPVISCTKEGDLYKLLVVLGDNSYNTAFTDLDVVTIAAKSLMEMIVDKELGFTLNDLIRTAYDEGS